MTSIIDIKVWIELLNTTVDVYIRGFDFVPYNYIVKYAFLQAMSNCPGRMRYVTNSSDFVPL